MPAALEFVPRLMPTPAAARYLGVSATTLRGLPIPRRTLGAKRLYDRQDLDAYADSLPIEHVNGSEEHEVCREIDRIFGVTGGEDLRDARPTDDTPRRFGE